MIRPHHTQTLQYCLCLVPSLLSPVLLTLEEAAQVETFRGRVSAYCISMELATDKLLPFLNKW